jgi:hypothetical protein
MRSPKTSGRLWIDASTGGRTEGENTGAMADDLAD